KLRARACGRCQVVRAIRCQALNRFDHTGVSAETSRGDSERRRLRDDVPFPPASAHYRAIVGGRERMAAGPKLVADRTEHGTEARRVSQALEPLQTSFALADGLVRVLDAVVLRPPRRWETVGSTTAFAAA